MRDRAIGQHHLLLEHVVDRLAVEHRARAARIVGHHAADRGAAGGRDVGREPEAVRLELRVQLVEHDARLDARPALLDVQLQNAIEILRGVDDDPGADGLAGLRRAAATHRQRTAMLRTDSDDADQIFARPRQDDPCRLDLIDAGVGGIERAGDAIETDLAGGVAFKIALQLAGGRRHHSCERPCRSRSSRGLDVASARRKTGGLPSCL